MGASSFTDRFDLPIIADEDKPTWRGDFNSAMHNIEENFDGVWGDNFTGEMVRQGFVTVDDVTHDAIQAALNSAVTLGFSVVAAGNYTTNQTLKIMASCDLSRLNIDYTGTGTAVEVGDNSSLGIYVKKCNLPRVLNKNKNVLGWSQVSGSIGYKIMTANSCVITGKEAMNFDIGTLYAGTGGGNAYNEYHVGQMTNNRINIQIMPGDAAGWSNQNNVLSGRCSHSSNEGVAVPNTRQIAVPTGAANLQNNWIFIGISLEGNVAEYVIECHGSYFKFDMCRYETQNSVKPRVFWGARATNNLIDGGYNVDSLVEVFDVGTRGDNRIIRHRGTSWLAGGTGDGSPVYAYENFASDTMPVDAIYPAGTRSANVAGDVSTKWVHRRTANGTECKASTDAFSRLTIDHKQGVFKFGDGKVAPVATVSFAADSLYTSANWRPLANNAQELGGLYSRWSVGYFNTIDLGGILMRKFGSNLQVSFDSGTTWRTVNLT